MSICVSCTGCKKNNNAPKETNNLNTIKIQPTFVTPFLKELENDLQPTNNLLSPKKLIGEVIVNKLEEKVSAGILNFDIGEMRKKSTIYLLIGLLIAVITVLLQTFKICKLPTIIIEMIICKIKNIM